MTGKKKHQNQNNNTLPADWFLRGPMDKEYKHYVLLSYLRQAEKAFQGNRLYPHLSELVFHYRNLKQFLEQKNGLYDKFPENLTGVDLKKLKLYYEKVIEDDDLMQELEGIVEQSLANIKPYLNEGKEIYEFVEEHMDLRQVGLISINPERGYLFLRNGDERLTHVYFYKLRSFDFSKENLRGITARYIDSFKRSLTNTYEAIKKELVRNYKAFPNPASYAIESRYQFPEQETLLPIAKRVLIRHLKTE